MVTQVNCRSEADRGWLSLAGVSLEIRLRQSRARAARAYPHQRRRYAAVLGAGSSRFQKAPEGRGTAPPPATPAAGAPAQAGASTVLRFHRGKRAHLDRQPGNEQRQKPRRPKASRSLQALRAELLETLRGAEG